MYTIKERKTLFQSFRPYIRALIMRIGFDFAGVSECSYAGAGRGYHPIITVKPSTALP